MKILCVKFLQSLQRVATRAFNTTARQMKNRVPEKQKLFQVSSMLLGNRFSSTDKLYRALSSFALNPGYN